MNPRLNRLKNDYEKMQELAARSSFVTIEKTEGNPPDKYVLHLTCKGIRELRNGKPIYSESHRLHINLNSNYPSGKPIFEMKTPVVHPNIASSGNVCIGKFSPAMRLDDVVIRAIKIIRYEKMDLEDSYGGTVKRWASENQHLFPLDERQILDEEVIVITILDEDEDDLDIKFF